MIHKDCPGNDHGPEDNACFCLILFAKEKCNHNWSYGDDIRTCYGCGAAERSK